MLRKSFPNLNWLKKVTDDQFIINEKGIKEPLIWPNVILNVKGSLEHRSINNNTLSIFTNISGKSNCKVENHQVEIDEELFFLSNENQGYTLEIEDKKTEIFNIHFGEKLLKEILESLINPADKLLSDETTDKSNSIIFSNQLYKRNKNFNLIIKKLIDLDNRSNLLEEEYLFDLLLIILENHREVIKKVKKLSPIKKSTKVEIYKRLALSIDYIYMNYYQNIELENLAKISCLSKYHYLRLFKVAFGITPYQFISKIRLKKAFDLLKKNNLPIHEIAFLLGFENSSSFSRFFYKKTKYYPQKYRDNCA